MVTLAARPEIERAKSVLRPFLRMNYALPGLVGAERFASAFGRTPNPAGVVLQALSQEPNSNDLCKILSGPIGELALKELAIEFPGWGLVFQLLPVAAQAICQQKNGMSISPVVAFGAFLLGAWLVLLAISPERRT